jgi:hypothetical protein
MIARNPSGHKYGSYDIWPQQQSSHQLEYLSPILKAGKVRIV